MSFIDRAREFILGKQFARIDLDRHYSNSPYNEARAYGERNKGIGGVEPILGRLQASRQSYLAEMTQYIEGERGREEALYSQLRKTGQRKQLFKWIALGAVLVLFLQTKLDSRALPSILWLFLFFLGIATFAVCVVSAVISLIYRAREAHAARVYQDYTAQAQAGFDRINRSHNASMRAFRTEIDDLYLASLDPAHREVILMRRDQERQHEEAMRLQEKALKLQEQHQQAIEEEQRRARQAQEKLLAIEEERERRRRGY